MDYLAIINSKEEYLLEVEALIREDQENEEMDKNAAICIQKFIRIRKLRRRHEYERSAIIQIQRLVRGYFGRKIAIEYQEVEAMKFHIYYLGYFALQIQRCYRGHRVRRHILDFHARKRFLEGAASRGEELKRQLENYADQCIKQQQWSELEERRHKLKCAAGRLHHLVGTQQQRGVFDPPPALIQTPTIDSVPVEEYLRNVVKDLLRARGRNPQGISNALTSTSDNNTTTNIKNYSMGTSLVKGVCKHATKDLRGSSRLMPQLPHSRISIQASSHYDAVDEENRRMLKEHKGKLFDQHGTSTIFHTPSQSDFLHHDPAPLCTNDPFVDKYANPALIRGIPRSQEEYKRSLYDRKAYFITTPGKPFYTATEGNKSTVLHNDLFDVIAEAEYSGGVGQRHLSAQMGVTSRYGLAECVDRRLVSPARVVHTSTTQSSLINKSICTNTAKKNTNKIIHKDYNLLSSILSSSSGKSQVRARVWNDDSDSDDEE